MEELETLLDDMELGELAVLALVSAVAERRNGVFDKKKDDVRLSKLLFLASYGKLDERGSVRGLLDDPRIDTDFVIYLFGVMNRNIYSTMRTLAEKRVIENIDVDKYKVNVRFKDVMRVIRSRNPELYNAIKLVCERYLMTESRDLTAIVNDLIGITTPEAKALFYGVDVKTLLRARERIRKLEKEGKIVDV